MIGRWLPVASLACLALIGILGLQAVVRSITDIDRANMNLSWSGDEPPPEIVEMWLWRDFGYLIAMPAFATLFAASLLALAVIGARFPAARIAERIAERRADAVADQWAGPVSGLDAHDERSRVGAEPGAHH
ncbi:hypothetical protein GE115_07420 [Agromyces sp. CFH 90414]|uniref:Uncharacterized protein n=1 Tax=Agromyces agglutinans TaxID=2662258 RepID=A0A6I2FFB1_9MICO|nr:hypothetical protein [Agromyces agglutinans]MRG59698.1 hypothetical protein [Agromyces agglutinans]